MPKGHSNATPEGRAKGARISVAVRRKNKLIADYRMYIGKASKGGASGRRAGYIAEGLKEEIAAAVREEARVREVEGGKKPFDPSEWG